MQNFETYLTTLLQELYTSVQKVADLIKECENENAFLQNEAEILRLSDIAEEAGKKYSRLAAIYAAMTIREKNLNNNILDVDLFTKGKLN